MSRVGVGLGVEGVSDKLFWDNVLNRSFREFQFDIRPLNGGTKLKAAIPRLRDQFRDLGHRATFILLDADKWPCATKAFLDLEEEVQREARQTPKPSRYLHICFALRELESWVLADVELIRREFQCPHYEATLSGDLPSGKRRLQELVRGTHGLAIGLEDRELARRLSKGFNPTAAMKISPSFRHFWNRLTECLSTVP